MFDRNLRSAEETSLPFQLLREYHKPGLSTSVSTDEPPRAKLLLNQKAESKFSSSFDDIVMRLIKTAFMPASLVKMWYSTFCYGPAMWLID